MGYTPVFNSVFDGTLAGKWPESAVWLTLLALCGKYGHVRQVVEIPVYPAESIGQAACVVMLRSRSLSSASICANASTCM